MRVLHSIVQRGTEHGDEITPQGFLSNNAGGVLGGITTGQDIVARIAIKPTSSIRTPRRSINIRNEEVWSKPSAVMTRAWPFAPRRLPSP